MHLAAQLTRSSWAPTISLGSHQNIGLHSGARANVVLLTYLPASFSSLTPHSPPLRLLDRVHNLPCPTYDWQTTGSSPRGRQAGTATTLPIICIGDHASAVTLVRCGGPGELQDRPPCLQMPPWSSSRLPIRSVHSGVNFRRSRQHAFIHEVGPTTVRPTNQNQDTGSTRVLLHLVCRVELAPFELAWSRTLAPLL